MIIIFGNGAKYFTEAEGKFICPNCNFIKKYLVKTSKDYFRLFFIPLIPLGEKSQPYVECQHCKNNGIQVFWIKIIIILMVHL